MEAIRLSDVTSLYSQGFILLDFTQLKPHPYLRPINSSFVTNLKQDHIMNRRFRQSQPISVIPVKDLDEADLRHLQKSSKECPLDGSHLGNEFLVIDGQHRFCAVKLLVSQLKMIGATVEPWHRQLLVQVYSKELENHSGILRAWMVFINNSFHHLAPSTADQLLAFNEVPTTMTEVFQGTRLVNIAASLRQSCLWLELLHLLKINVFNRSISPTLLEDWLRYSAVFDFLRFIIIDTVVQHHEIGNIASKRLHGFPVELKYEDFLGNSWPNNNERSSGTREGLQKLHSERRLNLNAFGYGEDALDEFIDLSLKHADAVYNQTSDSAYSFPNRIVLPDDLWISERTDLQKLLRKCEVVVSILAVLLFAGNFDSAGVIHTRHASNSLLPTWSQMLADELRTKVPCLYRHGVYVDKQIERLMRFILSNISSYQGIPDDRLHETLPHLLVKDSSCIPMVLSSGSWAHDILHNPDLRGPWLSLAQFIQKKLEWIPQDRVWVFCFPGNINQEMEEEAEVENRRLFKGNTGHLTDADDVVPVSRNAQQCNKRRKHGRWDVLASREADPSDENNTHDSESLEMDHQPETMTIGHHHGYHNQSQLRFDNSVNLNSPPEGLESTHSILLKSGPPMERTNPSRMHSSRRMSKGKGEVYIRTGHISSLGGNPNPHPNDHISENSVSLIGNEAQNSSDVVSSKRKSRSSDPDPHIGGSRVHRLRERDTRSSTKRSNGQSTSRTNINGNVGKSDQQEFTEVMKICREHIQILMNMK